MPEDLRPAPRLPLDTAETLSFSEGSLNAFVAREPGEPVYQVSLLQTLTPVYYPSAFNREVYEKKLSVIFPDQPTLENVVRPVLQEFLKTTPRPPQFPGTDV